MSNTRQNRAKAVVADKTNFNGVLTSAETDVQLALDKIDDYAKTGNFHIQDATMPSKNVIVSLSGATASTSTQLTFVQTDNRIINFPDENATLATNPTDARGQLIRRGASFLEKVDCKTNNRVVRGDGTDVISGQIDNPGFFTTDAVATTTTVGCVNNDAGNTTGTPIRGVTNGSSATSGFVGELLTTVGGSGASLTTTEWSDGNAAGLAIPAGCWDLQAIGYFVKNSATVITTVGISIGTVTGNNSTGTSAVENYTQISYDNGTSVDGNIIISTPIYRINLSSETTYYPKCQGIFATNTLTCQARLNARRIR
jgi:hypothetical protein